MFFYVSDEATGNEKPSEPENGANDDENKPEEATTQHETQEEVKNPDQSLDSNADDVVAKNDTESEPKLPENTIPENENNENMERIKLFADIENNADIFGKENSVDETSKPEDLSSEKSIEGMIIENRSEISLQDASDINLSNDANDIIDICDDIDVIMDSSAIKTLGDKLSKDQNENYIGPPGDDCQEPECKAKTDSENAMEDLEKRLANLKTSVDAVSEDIDGTEEPESLGLTRTSKSFDLQSEVPVIEAQGVMTPVEEVKVDEKEQEGEENPEKIFSLGGVDDHLEELENRLAFFSSPPKSVDDATEDPKESNENLVDDADESGEVDILRRSHSINILQIEHPEFVESDEEETKPELNDEINELEKRLDSLTNTVADTMEASIEVAKEEPGLTDQPLNPSNDEENDLETRLSAITASRASTVDIAAEVSEQKLEAPNEKIDEPEVSDLETRLSAITSSHGSIADVAPEVSEQKLDASSENLDEPEVSDLESRLSAITSSVDVAADAPVPEIEAKTETVDHVSLASKISTGVSGLIDGAKHFVGDRITDLEDRLSALSAPKVDEPSAPNEVIQVTQAFLDDCRTNDSHKIARYSQKSVDEEPCVEMKVKPKSADSEKSEKEVVESKPGDTDGKEGGKEVGPV